MPRKGKLALIAAYVKGLARHFDIALPAKPKAKFYHRDIGLKPERSRLMQSAVRHDEFHTRSQLCPNNSPATERLGNPYPICRRRIVVVNIQNVQIAVVITVKLLMIVRLYLSTSHNTVQYPLFTTVLP